MANDTEAEKQEDIEPGSGQQESGESVQADADTPESGQEDTNPEDNNSSGGSGDSLEAQLEAANTQVLELKDQLIREKAESQNVRKRVQKDVENARKFALEKFVAELLPVVDNLERAIDNTAKSDENTALLEGVELTYKSLLDALRKFNVEQLNPAGEPFDPQLHEAMTMVPNPEMEPNSVMDVMQKGYTLNGRLVRAAMVVVSK